MSRSFEVELIPKRTGTTALVAVDTDHCPVCLSSLRRVTSEEPVLFRHGGYGATRRTIPITAPGTALATSRRADGRSSDRRKRLSHDQQERKCSMNQYIEEHHHVDKEGRPAGGHSWGTGIAIKWQNGPLSVDGDRIEPNGAFVEGVIEAAIGRLEHYNSTEFRCRENSLAITHLQEALHWLQHRTADREARGVEGTHGL